MHYLIILLSLALSYTTYSQEDSLHLSTWKSLSNHHELEVDPVSIWFSRWFSIGHRVKYAYIFGGGSRISVETNGTVLNALDLNSQGGKWKGVFPKLNQSQIYFEHSSIIGRTKPADEKHVISSIIFRGGYHYFQHSMGTQNQDYWSIDSSAQTGLRTIAGFKSHAALIGISYDINEYDFQKYKLRTFNHRFSLDYLFSPYYQLKLYDSESQTDFNAETILSPLPVNRSGAQLSYRFMLEFKERFGIHADFEAIWVPFLKKYQPSSDYFVPRGGESIMPLFVNTRVGVYWRF